MENNIEGTNVNPNELRLINKDGAIGVHDLYEHFGVSISYEKADLLWSNFSQNANK